jgi:hypothetical protein
MKKSTTIYYAGQDFKVEYEFDLATKEATVITVNEIENPHSFFRKGIVDDLALMIIEEEANRPFHEMEIVGEAMSDESRGN